MSAGKTASPGARPSRGTWVLGIALLVCAALAHEGLVARVYPQLDLFGPGARWLLRLLQLALGGTGLALCLCWRRLRPSVVLVNLALVLLLGACVEGALAAALRWPAWVPSDGPLRTWVRELYFDERRVIQLDPQCAAYDPALTYTLRPGGCTFANREFRHRVAVNRAGLRDDERSLDAPEIIVLGDSHAMGWGVEGHQTFAQQLEAHTGRRVLLAAVSSYGTARQLGMLARLDLRRLRVLLVQYCDNDLRENEAFLAAGSLAVRSAQQYRTNVERYQLRTRYMVGRRLARLIQWRLIDPLLRQAAATSPAVPRGDDPHEARVFRTLLEQGLVDLGVPRLPVLVFEVNAAGENDGGFIRALEAQSPPSTAGPEIVPVSLVEHLRDEHFYRLDDHLTEAGHRQVAEVVLDALVGHLDDR